MARTQRPKGTGRTIAVGWSTPETDQPAVPAAPRHDPSSSGGPSANAPAPERRGPRRPLLIGAIVLVLALVLALPPLLLGGSSAEQTATRFLQGVLDGDAEIVREHLAPSDGALDIALTDEILTAAPERAESFSIDQTNVTGDSAEVIASLTLDDYTLETTLQLERTREGLLRRPTWELQPVRLPVLRLEIPVGSEELVINGQVVEIPEEHRPEEAFGMSPIMLHVLPGTFEIGAQEIGDHLAPRPELVSAPPVLGSWVSPPALIGYELTETGSQQLFTELTGSLEECARSTSPRPAGCPLAAPEEVTDSGAWELTGTPGVIGEWSIGAFFSLQLVGTATFTVDPEDGAAPQAYDVGIDASAMAVLDRDGAITPEWSHWETGVSVCLDAVDGSPVTYAWSGDGGVVECTSGD